MKPATEKLMNPFRFSQSDIVKVPISLFVVVSVLGLTLFAHESLVSVSRPAQALPAGFFFLELSSATGVMDVENAGQQVTGLIQFNTPNMRDSQLWKERFPAAGTIGMIRIQNKLTGQCLADSSGSDARATIRPCSDEATLWQKIPQGQNRVVFRRTTTLTGPFANINVCPGRNGGFVSTLTCNDDNFSSVVVWQATLSPVGATSSPLTPSAQPVAPTGCQLFGAGGICGLVGFDCDPFSGVDEIVVSSGNIGVAVTGVQPQIGQIVGTYLNEGTATISVCAWKAGNSVCGNPIPNVTFGPRVCVHNATPPPICPEGLSPCAGACRPLPFCEHLQ
jgi:hypothetical protein